MESSSVNAVFSAQLSKKDLTISNELFKSIQEKKIITQIIDDEKQPSINIFATTQIYLSSIVPILHDFGFTIIDEVAYKIKKDKHDVYINRFNLKIDDTKNTILKM
jgi:glutamate dehydrogenase